MDIDTKGLTLKPTDHALRTIISKGLDPHAIRSCFENPRATAHVSAHPGQIRLMGNGVALVGKIEHGWFVLITAYQDGVLTPPRADQLNTPEGRRYAERYARGLGRG